MVMPPDGSSAENASKYAIFKFYFIFHSHMKKNVEISDGNLLASTSSACQQPCQYPLPP